MSAAGDGLAIGMLRAEGAPGPVALANALAARAIGARLYYFTPHDVDLRNERIHALYHDGAKWRRTLTPYPDVIDNDERSRAFRPIWTSLTRQRPITTHRLGGKRAVLTRLRGSGFFTAHLIPDSEPASFDAFLESLNAWGRAIIKPVRGAMGKDIVYLERMDSGYLAQSGTRRTPVDRNGLLQIFEARFGDRSHIAQQYIESRTARGSPFDIRLHVRRNGEGRWQTVKIYARIGGEGGVVSNLSAGGSIANGRQFLRSQFGARSDGVWRRLTDIAAQFPEQFQTLYPDRLLDALGIDLGLDRDGWPWLFEVNSFPGAMFFEVSDAVPRMGFAAYLARQHAQMQGSAFRAGNHGAAPSGAAPSTAGSPALPYQT